MNSVAADIKKIVKREEVDDFKKLTRRMDSIQRTLDLIFDDRNMIEDILARISALEQAVHLNREHQTDVQRDINQNTYKIQTNIEDKVDEVKKVIGEKTIVVKTTKGSVFSKLKKLISK